ncbi:MAG: hypothetical protein KDK34_03680 [Leptospiraceae bacterium]|nr:hypothetical protein [Leptospiraceae bacterium]
MNTVMIAFRRYLVGYMAALVLAIPLYLLVGHPYAKGFSVGLLIFAVMGLCVDYYAEQRGADYVRAIEQLETQVQPTG